MLVNKDKILAIVGPTAVGKTALSISLAQQFDGEIISGDSMQVYKKLDIGTAKVTDAERQGIPHFLIDERDITDGFTVADFVERATTLIEEITQRHHLPIIVGGTGFYLQALLQGLNLGVPADDAFRQHWQALLETHGQTWLWQQLAVKDPLAADKIPAGNSRRVIRALEVLAVTGKSIEHQQDQPNHYDAKIIGLNTERAQLYARINERVDKMIDNGLLAEAKWLYDHDGEQLQAGRGIGYKELFPYFAGEVDLLTAVALLKQNSRHYAKRQLTWFRHQVSADWFDLVNHPDEIALINQQVQSWVDK